MNILFEEIIQSKIDTFKPKKIFIIQSHMTNMGKRKNISSLTGFKHLKSNKKSSFHVILLWLFS